MFKHVHDLKKDLREKGWWEKETPEVSQTSFRRSEEMECSQWIAEKVSEMIECMNSEEIPESIIVCKNCAYARQMFNIK